MISIYVVLLRIAMKCETVISRIFMCYIKIESLPLAVCWKLSPQDLESNMNLHDMGSNKRFLIHWRKATPRDS